MYIKAYSEYMACSGIFRTRNIFSQFQTHHLGITQEQFMHILSLTYADPGIFRTPLFDVSRIFTHIQHP